MQQLGRPGSRMDLRGRRAGRGSPTHGDFGEHKLSLLCEGLGLPDRVREQAAGTFRLLANSWFDWPLGRQPIWPNDITDDGTPFEFSVAFGSGVPKIRMLTEAQELPLTLQSSWRAGVALTERLHSVPGVDLQPFERVGHLFAPAPGATARFALWHSAVVDPDRFTLYKIYVNPQIHGDKAATEIVRDTFAKLNFGTAYDFLSTRRCEGRQILYLSLDLLAGPEARVKVYMSHPGIRAGEIEPAMAGTRHYEAGSAEKWLRLLAGATRRFDRRPILTCLSFTSLHATPTATLHVPIRDYVSDDGASVERACELLGAADGATLRRAICAFAGRPLEAGSGLLTYVSLKSTTNGASLTTYISPEAFAVASGARRVSKTSSRVGA